MQNEVTVGSSTLRRALDVLEALGTVEPEGLTAAQVAQRLDMNRVTVHRILQSFRARGYVRQEGPGRPYKLGLRLLGLGEEIVANFDVAGREVFPAGPRRSHRPRR